MTSPIVVAPDFTFSELDQLMRELGWTLVVDPTVSQPFVNNEPELASWHYTVGDVDGDRPRLVYGFDPATLLRVLSLDESVADATVNQQLRGEVERVVPQFTERQIVEMLQSSNEIELLRAIRALRELKSAAHIEALTPLLVHNEPSVATEARETMQQLITNVVQAGQQSTFSDRAQSDLDMSLDELADPQLRRQVFRWMIAHDTPLTAEGVSAVETALTDSDWETRMSAMLATGRLGMASLRSATQRVEIPSGAALGLDHYDVTLLVAMREVVVAQLDGRLDPQQLDESLKRVPGIPETVVKAILGQSGNLRNRETQWISSFTTPAHTLGAPPESLPAGIARVNGRYFLRDSDIELVWVAPVTHWLGDDSDMLPTHNPIRRHTPSNGFFIARYPIAPKSEYVVPLHPSNGSYPMRPNVQLETYDGARAVCNELAEQSEIRVCLPSADEWEMAARGPDGRRYPTGNGLEREMLLRPSPWGIYYAVGVVEQWTTTRNEHGQLLTCGKWRAPRCAARVVADPRERSAIRPVVLID